MSLRRRQHLVVFARPARLGVGKRRLAAAIGDLAAWRFARATLSDLHRRVGRDPRWTAWLAVTPDRAALARGWPRGVSRFGQGPGDLGARMSRVLAGRRRGRPRGRVVIVGSDVPGITRADIAAAFRALGRRRHVFGPAADGGYWLVGTRAWRRGMLAGVRWSGPHALADSLASLPGHDGHALLRVLEDVDDAAAHARQRRAGGRACPR